MVLCLYIEYIRDYVVIIFLFYLIKKFDELRFL